MAAGGFSFGFIALALPFIAALISLPVVRLTPRTAPWLLAVFPAAIFVLVAREGGIVAAGGIPRFGVDWVPSFGSRLAFRLDGLAFVFALLISGIGALVTLFSGGYLAGERRLGRFLVFLFLFMGAMLGLVLADDLVTLAVFWEATSIASFLLIGFDHERECARRGAVQALAITGGGGLALLAAVVLIRETTGLTSLTAMLASGDTLRQSASYEPVLALILVAAFTKSAQMPFHVWLPNAMEAPTPVSAYLHSATMVKAGVYLLMRFNPVLGDTPLWETILALVGGTTLVLGAGLALCQSDLKLVLAYTTVASLGLLVMLVGVGGEAAIEAAVLYLIAHALFKGGLFMAAGAIDRGAGTRDVRALGGLGAAMPLTFAAAFLCALSMGGLTPFFGFLAKEDIYAATAGGDHRSVLVAAVAVAGNAMMVAAAFAVALKPFIGTRPADLRDARDGSALLLAGPLLLGIAGLAAGLFSSAAHAFLTDPMASAVAGRPVAATVSAVPHPDLAFALSLLTIALGIALALVAASLRRSLAAVLGRIGWGPDRGFDQAMAALLRIAFLVTRKIQSGRLDHYMTTAFAVIAFALLAPMIANDAMPAMPRFPVLRFHEWVAAGMLVAGLYAVLAAHDRLTAIVSLGIQGLAVALIFIMLGAPDLSFTQFMVETLSVLILALAMTRLKLTAADRRPWRVALKDASVAILCGAGFALLLQRIVERPLDMVLPEFFTRHSYALAHGQNIVNVIIVDFRGIDTLGEIAVVLTTGLAILALIGIRIRGKAEVRQ